MPGGNEGFLTQTIRSRDEAMTWFEQHGPNAPIVGEMAPDFELWDVAGEDSVRLSDFRGHTPVALIMGSFT